METHYYFRKRFSHDWEARVTKEKKENCEQIFGRRIYVRAKNLESGWDLKGRERRKAWVGWDCKRAKISSSWANAWRPSFLEQAKNSGAHAVWLGGLRFCITGWDLSGPIHLPKQPYFSGQILRWAENLGAEFQVLTLLYFLCKFSVGLDLKIFHI